MALGHDVDLAANPAPRTPPVAIEDGVAEGLEVASGELLADATGARPIR